MKKKKSLASPYSEKKRHLGRRSPLTHFLEETFPSTLERGGEKKKRIAIEGGGGEGGKAFFPTQGGGRGVLEGGL